MAQPADPTRSLAPRVRAVLADRMGRDMADRIIVGSCNILAVDENELYGDNFDLFVERMELVIPAIIGLRPAEAVIGRLRELKNDAVA
jgi:hypothetical protein